MLEVIVEGPEDGPPLLMLPSSQRDAGDFDESAALLAQAGFHVLRPWGRGMGGSNGTLEGMSLYTLAADAVFALRHLAAEQPAIWIGHAFGHFVARVADLAFPEWVRGVVVAAAAARTFPAGIPLTLETASDTTLPEAVRLAALQKGFFAPGNNAAPWLRGWHPHVRAAYRCASAVPDKDAWWPVTHAPILDLQAAHDPWRPPDTRDELRDALGDKVTVRVIEKASHALLVEQPRAVAEAVLEWIGSAALSDR